MMIGHVGFVRYAGMKLLAPVREEEKLYQTSLMDMSIKKPNKRYAINDKTVLLAHMLKINYAKESITYE